MKFFGSSIFTFGLIAGSFFTSAAVIPAEKAALAPIEKRAVDLNTAIGIVQSVYTKVQVVTGKINSTVAGLSNPVNPVEGAAAALEFNTAITEITAIVTGGIAEINGAASNPVSRALAVRQATSTDLAGLVTNLLLEISGALNGILAVLGLQALLAGTLGGLVAALSALLLALVPVVDNLLELVRRLLDGLLIGLSAALAGLII
ncbi:hypothetical protein AOL_s00169g214 [Orbilia oligospora ATCC 24927]|uniref:Uncharacterized protein n=2 Tax=Orbilia oligospora TaxID=2813651 RepID=G1XN11_ARTOA|nr:hypothetical protein AOL_s00169g214 [Orbilia oligospora ATCC 24927]EGX45608.1 hypothetical protein AOL_s00169g214 [Orbilia oligospora ATCC 24927]KAF3283328.1 hypothetical protein TWF970_001308 [Orbilia oligospora]